LIELLITTAMISVISVAIFYFAFSSVRMISRTSDILKSDQSVRFVAAKISSDIEQSAGASTGSAPGRLVIGNISYQFVENKVRREEGSDVYNLTDDGDIKGLKFSYPSSKLIKIEITPKIGKAASLNAFARN
jgi:Tfp pilus assembly protein PilW